MKTLLMLLLAVASAGAQTLDLKFDALSAKAKQKVEIALEGPMLTQALQQAPPKLRDYVTDVSSVAVRHYEFDQPGQYSDADLEAVRKQVPSSSGWSRLLNVKEEHQSVEVYMLTAGPDGKVAGLLLIAAEPKELTVVHLVGSVDLANLQEVVKSTIHYDLKTTPGPGPAESAHP